MTRFHMATAALVAALGCEWAFAGGAVRLWLIGLSLAAYAGLTGAGVAFIRLEVFCDALCRLDTSARAVALTFDDGPDPAVTPPILDTLAAHGVRATFFCVGRRAEEHPEIVRRIVAEGHEVANHAFSHAWWTNFLLTGALTREIALAQQSIERAGGGVPQYFRPPFGLTNPHVRRAVSNLGLVLVGWNVRSLDRGAQPDAAIRRVLDRAAAGSIILLHDGGVRPAEAVEILDGIIKGLQERGYAFCALDGSLEPRAQRCG